MFSAASIWQIAIKRALGRLEFAFKPEAVAQAALDTKFDELAVRQTHAARIRHLSPLHAGPFAFSLSRNKTDLGCFMRLRRLTARP